MIRKKTAVVLILFLVLLAAAIYLQKNPLPAAASVTPSPTSQVKLLSGITTQDIVSIELMQGPDDSLVAERNAQGGWAIRIGDETRDSIAPGKIEQARDELASALIITTLPEGYSLEAVGIAQSIYRMTIGTSAGDTHTIVVGNETPTRSGTYVQVDNSTPVVIDSVIVDTVYNLLVEASTPDTTLTPATTVP